MRKRDKQIYNPVKDWESFLKSSKRREKLRLKRAGYQRHQLVMKKKAEAEGRLYKTPKKSPFLFSKKLPPKPDYPLNIKYLSTIPELFSKNQFNQNVDGHLFIPNCFSLIENYEESYDFLKRLFIVLNKNSALAYDPKYDLTDKMIQKVNIIK